MKNWKKSSFFVFVFFSLLMMGSSFLCQGAEIKTESKPETILIKVDGVAYELSKDEIANWRKFDSTLSINRKYRSEIENTHYCSYKKSFLCELTFSYKKESHVQISSRAEIDDEKIKKYLGDLARQTNRDPENAKLTMEDGKATLFSLEKDGIKLDEPASLEVFKKALGKTGTQLPAEIVLPYMASKPEVGIDSIDNMGITTLIGEGKSNFRGSPKNRIFNIKVATNRFNGVLIKPGEEFSFVKVLGEVDGEHGYLPELVIKKDKTEPEFGGGICQVSTTAFRAAINAGLEITARRNHAYPVSYYNPQGMDATVYVPRPDLRFKNNTPAYILIQTKIEGTELIFDFYGTSDGRKTNVIGPKIISRTPDGGMKTTFTQQIFDKDNNLIREDVFNSSYDSPNKYPHPGQTTGNLTTKPKDWSDSEWKKYKKEHGM